ncbi:MAG: hypothetical protein GF401_02575 [Chitinivibrionales bacterium]|nr:hypothetical protein [Chitinivibrionales bacterium]
MTIHKGRPFIGGLLLFLFVSGGMLKVNIARAERNGTSGGGTVQFDTLIGPLPKVVKAQEGPYIVAGDIEVPSDRTVTIEPGTIFLFRPFAGLHVQGRLIAEGSKARPIVFTSHLDQEYNPSSTEFANPYDWNGIYIHTAGYGTRVGYCKIYYSVYGIVSETKFIRLDPVIYKYNGKSNLVVEGAEHRVSDKPYSYVLSTKDAVKDGVPVDLLKDPLAPKRNFLRYAGLTAFLGGCTLGIFQTFEAQSSQGDLDEISRKEFSVLNSYSSEEWTGRRNRRNEDVLLASAGYVIGLVGATGFVWSFSF